MVKQNKLPQKIINIPNVDNMWHELPDKNDLCNMPHPSRVILCAPPNTGKTLIVKILLLHKMPIYDRICIYVITIHQVKNMTRLIVIILMKYLQSMNLMKMKKTYLF